MLTYDRIFQNNRKWVADKIAADPDFFESLAKGQEPLILYIGCSDSRVTAEDLMGAGPGEVFVHRNIGNVVSATDLNVMSVITYAIDHLHVKHIVVCGHYYCGGVKAAMQAKDLGLLNPWLTNIRDIYRLNQTALDAIVDEDQRYNRLIELNVEEQCLNIIKTAAMQREYLGTGYPQVHGWVFDVKTGKLIDLEIDFRSKLQGVWEIYNLGTGDHVERS
jgi:carbonic anhydrase